jgi:preprotein translocase subunit SecB
MTTNEQSGNDAGPGDVRDTATGPQLALQSVYLKDCSYEAPNGPRIEGAWNPQISLDLNTTVNGLTPELREVVLTVTVAAKHDEATVFLVEVKQAGVFMMRNLSDLELNRAIGSICPSVLFPYARAAVSQLVTQGGFPQFLLPPVNFDALQARTEANGSVAKN